MKTTKLLKLMTALALLTSCEQEVYDKGEGTYSQMRADFIQLRTDATSHVAYVITDDGDSLTLSQPYTAKWLSTPDSTYRALLYYNKVAGTDRPGGAAEAEVIALNRVLSAHYHPLAYYKGNVKTDPVKFESLWVGRNRRYLTIGMSLLVGSTEADVAGHRLGFVADTLVVNPDGTRTHRLRLYHDQGGMPEYYSQRTYFSLPLAGTTADSMAITINTYAGTVTKTVCTRQ